VSGQHDLGSSCPQSFLGLLQKELLLRVLRHTRAAAATSRSEADDSGTSEFTMSARRRAEVVAPFEGGLLDAGHDEFARSDRRADS